MLDKGLIFFIKFKIGDSKWYFIASTKAKTP